MGITNTFATIPGFVTPLLTNMITTADPDTEPELLKEQWREVRAGLMLIPSGS